ncbi:hypothetical protein DV737_g387, partial [Chaetothyriales sp. CBS 132003]
MATIESGGKAVIASYVAQMLFWAYLLAENTYFSIRLGRWIKKDPERRTTIRLSHWKWWNQLFGLSVSIIGFGRNLVRLTALGGVEFLLVNEWTEYAFDGYQLAVVLFAWGVFYLPGKLTTVPGCFDSEHYKAAVAVMPRLGSRKSRTGCVQCKARHVKAVWAYKVPEQAFQFPFLSHAMLAFSAHHLAHLDPASHHHYSMRASAHQVEASRGMRSALLTLDCNNCHAVFASASLLALIAFVTSGASIVARQDAPSRRGQQNPLAALVDISLMLRGMDAVIEDTQELIQLGPLAPVFAASPCTELRPQMAALRAELNAFAFQSSVILYNTVKSFQSHNTRVRDLADEVQELTGVLGPLSETLSTTTGLDLSCLDLPLFRCGNACKEFQQELLKCSSRSGGSRTSFRDWAKLRYMGDDIDGFRRLLAGYKLTITIALTDANLRKSSITAESLEGFKELVETASDDLQAHLEAINEKLDMVLKRAVPESPEECPAECPAENLVDSNELRLMKEERLSTQRCLEICDQLSQHINQIQIPPRPTANAAGAMGPDPSPESLMSEGLQECRTNLTATAAKLENHMKTLTKRLVARSKAGVASEDEAEDLTRLYDEWETARQCISICSKADGHLKENVMVIDNYATGDAVQFMVSTNGKILHGKNRGLGWRTRQVGGYLSGPLVAQLSKDMSRMSYNTAAENDGADQQGKPLSGLDESVESPRASNRLEGAQPSREGAPPRLEGAPQADRRPTDIANERQPLTSTRRPTAFLPNAIAGSFSSPLPTGLNRPAATMQTCQASTGAALRAGRLSPKLRTAAQRRNLQDISITRTGKPIIRVQGGRSSLGGNTATVFGATGFLGRYIVNRLARRGCNVVVPYREEMTKRHLKPAGDLGRVTFVEFDLRNTASIEESVRHSDLVFNLIGRTYPTKNFSLWDVHVEGTERIAEAVAKYDCDRFIQVSSYNADAKSPAEFFRTKGEGERVARTLFPETTIVRPAPLFGFEDHLLHRLAGVTNILTVNHMQERFWPVHVIDVGKALERIAFDDTTAGETFELYGPTNYSMAEIAAIVDREILHERRHINVPKAILKPIAYYLNRLLWWPILSADELEVECLDQHIDKSAKTLADLGIEPAELAGLTYHYLQDYRSSSYYDLPPATARERSEEKKYLHVIDDQ